MTYEKEANENEGGWLNWRKTPLINHWSLMDQGRIVAEVRIQNIIHLSASIFTEGTRFVIYEAKRPNKGLLIKRENDSMECGYFEIDGNLASASAVRVKMFDGQEYIIHHLKRVRFATNRFEILDRNGRQITHIDFGGSYFSKVRHETTREGYGESFSTAIAALCLFCAYVIWLNWTMDVVLTAHS